MGLWRTHSILRHTVDQLPNLGDHIAVVLPPVGKGTAGAVFGAVFSVGKISPAGRSQSIKRTVTEQTVEVVRVPSGVTGEIFTISMAEKGTGLFLPAGGMIGHGRLLPRRAETVLLSVVIFLCTVKRWGSRTKKATEFG